MILIVAICAQSVLLIVAWVAGNSFVGVDRLDVGANGIFLGHHRRRCTIRRVGGDFLVIVEGHVGGRRNTRKGARDV